jgi:signal transduction histidine kinase
MQTGYWWANGGKERRERERLLAEARVLLAAGCVAAVYLNPVLAGPHLKLSRLLFFAYFACSVVNLVISRVSRSGTRGQSLFSYTLDLAAACLATLSTGGARSPFLMLYLFVLLVAAERWGMKGSLLTAVACVVLFLVPAMAFPGVWTAVRSLKRGFSSPGATAVVSMGILIVGGLLGHLAEEDKRQRTRALILNRLIGVILPKFGLKATLECLMLSLRGYFDADQVRLVLRRQAEDDAFLWEARRPTGRQIEAVHFSKLGPAEREAYFATPPETVWPSFRRHPPRPVGRLSLRSSSPRVVQPQIAAFSALGTPPISSSGGENADDMRVVGEREAHFTYFGSLLAISFSYGRDWYGRLLVYSPNRGRRRKGDVQFLETLARELGPALYNMYHVRRLRSWARAAERNRLANELHDGIIQSLAGMELRASALQREASADPSYLLREINRFQALLRGEIMDLREKMQMLKSVDVEPQQLVSALAQTVNRFRRDQSLSASFVCNSEEVTLPLRVCSELVRILQEALTNVRKHSGAHNVFVHFGFESGKWKLLVEDDGCGFGFAGRQSLAELEAAGDGPQVIGDRVRSIGGELVIESVPGCGARLEISVAPRPYEQAA